jgi:hypothetical protein
MAQATDLPAHVGPCELSELGKLVAVRCPAELAHILRCAGAMWEPGSRRWLVQWRRIGPVIRALERATDPLFRHVGFLSPLDRTRCDGTNPGPARERPKIRGERS